MRHVPWIEFVCSLLVGAVSIPLFLGKVSRNEFYGARTPRTMNGSESTWFAVNKIVARTMIIGSIISAVLDIALAFLPMPRIAVYTTSIVALLAAVLVPIVIHRKLLF